MSHWLRIGERGLLALGLGDLDELLRPVVLLRLRVAHLHHAANHLKNGGHCEGGLLEQRLQRETETLLHNGVLRTGFLLQEIEEVEIERVWRCGGLCNVSELGLECGAVGVDECVEFELVQKQRRLRAVLSRTLLVQLFRDFSARGDHLQALLQNRRFLLLRQLLQRAGDGENQCLLERAEKLRGGREVLAEAVHAPPVEAALT